MTIIHASHHTDVSTVNYSSLHTQRKLHHCVTDVKRQYPIAPLFWGDLAHAQTVCTRLFFLCLRKRAWGEATAHARTHAVAGQDKLKNGALLLLSSNH